MTITIHDRARRIARLRQERNAVERIADEETPAIVSVQIRLPGGSTEPGLSSLCRTTLRENMRTMCQQRIADIDEEIATEMDLLIGEIIASGDADNREAAE